MTYLSGSERAHYVQDMFTRIAPRYDVMNRLMTFGQDISWRRLVIERARLAQGSWLLDLGTGTGDIAGEALKGCPDCNVVGADFTLQMMRTGQPRYRNFPFNWSAADAARLPFADGVFDAVVSGFLLRNLVNLPASLAEQLRVLKHGGRFVALDTTPPPQSILTPFLRLHLRLVIPTLGRLVTGQAEAYRYLPETTENFLAPERLAARLITTGFEQVGYRRLMLDTIAVYWGVKPG